MEALHSSSMSWTRMGNDADDATASLCIFRIWKIVQRCSEEIEKQ